MQDETRSHLIALIVLGLTLIVLVLGLVLGLTLIALIVLVLVLIALVALLFVAQSCHTA
jgi:hypothetical protein